MGKVAKDRGPTVPELPAVPLGADELAATPRAGILSYGLPVAEVLTASSLAGSRVLAGAAGLTRVVQRLNVMEVPDILPWVKSHELLLTTGYPLRNTPEALADLVAELDARGLAALGVKLGRYLDELPGTMLATADRLGFPILRLPDDVAFDEVLNQVLSEVLDRQAAVLGRADEAHRALVQVVLAGGDLQAVVDELVRLLGGAVLVTSPDGRVLAAAGTEDALTAATATSVFDAAGRLRTDDDRIGLSPPDSGPGNWAVVPIVAGALDHGRIAAYSPAGQLVDSDVPTLERGAMVAALAITKQLAVAAVETKYRGDFLRDLVTGRAGAADRAVAHCASLGWDIDRPVVVLAAELEPVSDESAPPARRNGLELRPVQERFAAAWTQVVRARDPKAPVVGFSSEVVAVLGAAPGRDVPRLVRENVTAVPGEGCGGRRICSSGVSRVVQSPDRLPEAYEQARRAVAIGRQVNGVGGIAHFDSLGVFRLLSLVPDSAELRSFLTETLGELADRDDAGAADLRRTLRVLLDTNLNVAETARILHFHYNTLRYRIGKLQGMLGPFTEDPHLRLNISLALRVQQMRGLDPVRSS